MYGVRLCVFHSVGLLTVTRSNPSDRPGKVTHAGNKHSKYMMSARGKRARCGTKRRKIRLYARCTCRKSLRILRYLTNPK